ncbi:hypothetical protein GRI38_08715 [Altererythrobacter aurantiacus]|uniref:Uncharacterized protein n=1 Tax=Parapontixanthobacter aurantiacus TaxID=1463599 RepID=A0A844ZEA2_9SPHN|nr:hypothetical protein [Parapontixanthobacter aurantiacus]
MSTGRTSERKNRLLPALLAASCVLAVPATGLALDNDDGPVRGTMVDARFAPFTPANIDPAFAREVAASIGAKGLRFTPADSPVSRTSREVTVAVRVDPVTARAISVRRAIADTASESASGRSLAIAPTGYNLGISRGYQSFAKPAQPAVPSVGRRDTPLADLDDFALERRNTDKPSRFRPTIVLDTERGTMSRSATPLDPETEQRMDISGSYSVTRNLDVTAGVRYSQERDRIAPLTDEVQDSQAVYVGTQFRF